MPELMDVNDPCRISAWEPIYGYEDDIEGWECRKCGNAICADECGLTPEEWEWHFCPFCGFKFQ